jgi:hypothetical protein
VDPPLAEVVSFAEKARLRRRSPAEGLDDVETAESSAEPEDLARQAMFRRFGQLARSDSPPRAMRSVDDELAVLVYDSSTAGESRAGVRGAAAPESTRQLTFQGPDLFLEVELNPSSRELTCQVVPPQRASLEVRHLGGTLDLGADEFGTFYVSELPAGSICLRCLPLADDSASTATSWITV